MEEQVYPTQWQEAIVIPILKPGKDPKNPLSYRPIALTSCLLYVGCGVVIEDIMLGYRLDTSCSIFTAEAVAIYRALQLIDSTLPRKYCIYTDNMSVLEALENYHDRCHPVVCTILDITSRLYSKGFRCRVFAGYQVT
ncbi:pggt1b [Trichonephila clavipes]|nr:pggt1b [Trichonephila clavipes]